MIGTEVVVVGGGIAGVSAAYALSEYVPVILLERESSLAFHTTGRSAAHFIENYGAAAMRALSRASRPFFDHPPSDLSDGALLGPPSGGLLVGREEQLPLLEQEAAAGHAINKEIQLITGALARELVPVLRPEHAVAAVWEPTSVELDVAAIHQAFVRGIRRNGGQIVVSAPVSDLRRHTGAWKIRAGGETYTAGLVVNAGGAWGDELAAMAGARPIGLEPRRRTVFMTPGSAASRHWPLVANAGYEYYFKPDGNQLLCSLSDETPSEPCDARPREVDVALAIDRINAATVLDIRTVRSSWAGLRTFAPDEDIVIGFDPDIEGFFWFVGQGGTGIQSSPAAGGLAARLALGVAPDFENLGISAGQVDPARFRP